MVKIDTITIDCGHVVVIFDATCTIEGKCKYEIVETTLYISKSKEIIKTTVPCEYDFINKIKINGNNAKLIISQHALQKKNKMETMSKDVHIKMKQGIIEFDHIHNEYINLIVSMTDHAIIRSLYGETVPYYINKIKIEECIRKSVIKHFCVIYPIYENLTFNTKNLYLQQRKHDSSCCINGQIESNLYIDKYARKLMNDIRLAVLPNNSILYKHRETLIHQLKLGLITINEIKQKVANTEETQMCDVCHKNKVSTIFECTHSYMCVDCVIHLSNVVYDTKLYYNLFNCLICNKQVCVVNIYSIKNNIIYIFNEKK